MSYIKSESCDGVLILTLARPTHKNALSLEMYSDLVDALDEYEGNKDLRVAVIQGDETCFCAGNDLKDFLDGGQLNDSHPTVRFIHKIAQLEKPLIAAVAGPAVGIGTTMLLHCDMVVAAENSLFKLPFAQLGLCPEAGSSYLLPKLAGSKLAFELLVLGKSFDADVAEKIGLINRRCAPESLLSTTLELAKELARLPNNAVCASRKLLRQSHSEATEEAIRLELEYFQTLLDGEESQTIIRQFFNKS